MCVIRRGRRHDNHEGRFVRDALTSPPLTQPVVEELEEDTPTWEVDELDSSSPESERPPPPGFPRFLFPEDDGGMNADEICAKFGKYVAETCQQTDTKLCDIPDETEVPELVVPRPPSPKDMSDVMPTVGYACVPLLSVNNGVMPELIRMPAFPQTMGRAKHGENMVPMALSWKNDRRNRLVRSSTAIPDTSGRRASCQMSLVTVQGGKTGPRWF